MLTLVPSKIFGAKILHLKIKKLREKFYYSKTFHVFCLLINSIIPQLLLGAIMLCFLEILNLKKKLLTKEEKKDKIEIYIIIML